MKMKTTEDIIVPIDDVFMINVDDTLNKDTLKVVSKLSFKDLSRRIPYWNINYTLIL